MWLMQSLRQAQFRRSAWVCYRCRALSTVSKRDIPKRPQNQKLPATPARTRFAPSPTGYLHLGSLRTALFNYLTAKATGGQFILRLEDTDQKRTVKDAESRLYQDLGWAGLQWDEGPDIGGPYGSYKQSERTILYQTYATKLLESGDAYRCFCSTERLNNLAKERNRLGLPSDYDRACANVSKEESDDRSSRKEPYVIRLKVPDVLPHFTDLVYGVVGKRRIIKRLPSQRAQPSYEDPVLLKSDGLPTYHLANVVDDHFMEITHVIRAAEWMSSTPKHMVMYDAFKWQPPTFAHVGLLQDSSRQKFSKRDSSLDIYSFKEDGIFPEALVNYVALFGWSHRQGNDFLNLQDLVENFDLKFTKGNTIVTPNKLVHLQKRYAQKYVSESQEYFASMVVRVLEVAQKHLENHPKSRFCTNDELREKVAALLRVDAANYSTPREFFERNQHFLCVEPRPECVVREGDLVTGSGLEYIGSELSKVSNDQWNEERLKQSFDLAVKKMEEGRTDDFSSGYRKSLQHFLRWALTGGRPGPSIIASLSILGRDESLSRIKDADAILEDLGI